MNAYKCAPVAANYRGADEIANQHGMPVDSNTILELIIRSGGSVACLMHVQAERCAAGWHFSGFIPNRVLLR